MKLFSLSGILFFICFIFLGSCGIDDSVQYTTSRYQSRHQSNVCFVQDDKLVIKELIDGHKECSAFLQQYEEKLKKYLIPGDFAVTQIPEYSVSQKTAMMVFLKINQKRIAARSNEVVELYLQTYLLNEIHLREDSSEYKNSIAAIEHAKDILSDLPDAVGVKRPEALNVLVFPKKYSEATQKENERVLYDVSSEKREFDKQTVFNGKYLEEDLYDALKRVANIFYVPRNGLIVAVQDMVDGKNNYKIDTSPYSPFRDTFFYLYRDGQRKKVIEVLANLRGGDSPYQKMGEYGLAKFFGDVHRKGTDIPALRGVGRWDVESGSFPEHKFGFRKLYNEDANSGYNMHPGGYDSLSSAGCATIRNRAKSGYSKDYFVFMGDILQYSFHSNDYLGDDYDQEAPSIAARINLNAVYLKKVITYNK